MADMELDVTVASRFISNLSKSLQALCHGCMDFDTGIEIVGYINVNIDSGSKVDYVLNEKVLKSNTNSMTFVSNSFLAAKKEVPKQMRDGACSPIPQARQVNPFYHRRSFQGYHHLPQSAYRGSYKRPWSSVDKEWRAGHGKRASHGRASNFATPTLAIQNTSQSFSEGPPSDSNNTQVQNIKQEVFDSASSEQQLQSDTSNQLTSEQSTENFTQQSLNVDIKRDPDAKESEQTESESQIPFAPGENKSESELKDTFLQPSGSLDPAEQSGPIDQDSNPWPNSEEAGASMGDPGPAEYEEMGQDSQDQSGYQDGGEGSSETGQFEVIEIGDEDDDVQGLFGDSDGPGTSQGASRDYTAAKKQQDTLAPNYFPCNLCGEICLSSYMLRQHFSQFHGEHLAFRCAQCGRGFVSYSGLRHHRQTHQGRTFACEICGKQFKHKHHMKDHIRSKHSF